ncbi:uncharacterized protein LOC119596514 isoform X2 [Penaeus monodon]|uniref:uncharacterized protein LOC119596514 isoform X2 n=1 Tax=Penaeus monodon TaxID=6687 RepID=UPI0018A707D5|nr:uncharacterized protein LOC119596514 isoform X2 [Penaeus monodon]
MGNEQGKQVADASQEGTACPSCEQAFDPVLRQPIQLPVSNFRICKPCLKDFRNDDLVPSCPEGSEDGELSVKTSSNETKEENREKTDVSEGDRDVCRLCKRAFDPVQRQPITLPVSKLKVCKPCFKEVCKEDLEQSCPNGSVDGKLSIETSNKTEVEKAFEPEAKQGQPDNGTADSEFTSMDEKKNASAPAPGMDPKTKKILIGVGIGVGATVGAVGAIVAAPFALAAAGFTSGGIAAGSFAASMMSSAAIANGGAIAAGSTVAILQSAGAAGIGAAATAGLAAGGGAVGLAAGGATAVGVNKLMGSKPSQENETNNGNETETLKHEDGEKGDEKGEGRSGNDEKEERKEEEGRLGNDEEEENK